MIRSSLLLESIDRETRKREREAKANPGDVSALERTRAAQSRGGKHGEAAKTLKQITRVRGEQSAKQRGKLKFRAMRKWQRPVPFHPKDDPQTEEGDREIRRRAILHTNRIISAWNEGEWTGLHRDNNKRWEKVDKAVHHLHRLSDKHEVMPHFYFPDYAPHVNVPSRRGGSYRVEETQPDHRNADIDLMAHVYKTHQHAHDTGRYSDNYESSGVAKFEKEEHADGFMSALGDRHNIEKLSRGQRSSRRSGGVARKLKPRYGSWEVHYGAGQRQLSKHEREY